MSKPRYNPAPLSGGAPHQQRRNWLRIRHRNLGRLCWLIAVLLSANCDRSAPPTSETIHETQTGLASYYGKGFHGQETASGETFDKNELVAAHPRFPLGTRARVTNLENNQRIEVRVIDRGPAPDPQAEGVIIDLSEGAAKRLDLQQDGRVKVRVEVLEWGTQ